MSTKDQYLVIDSEFVICKICNNKYKIVGNKHLRKHNLTLEKYIELYPEEPTITKKRLEDELLIIEKRKDGCKNNKNRFKEIPCFYHPEVMVKVTINSPNTVLCDECKKSKKVLPRIEKGVKTLKNSIQEKYGVDNISKLQSIKDKKKITFDSHKEQNENFLTEINNKRQKTLKEIFGENWKDVMVQLQKDGMLDKYGVEHPLQVSEFVEKFKETWTKKSKEEIEEIVSKVKQTKLENHGSENYNNIEKITKTNIERYGGSAPTCDPNVIKKRQENNLEKYNYKETLSVPEVKEKIRKKFNKDGWPSQRPEWKEKYIKTSNKKFGANSWADSEEGRKISSEREIKKFLPRLQKYLDYLKFEIIDLPYRGAHAKHIFKCKVCKIEFEQNWNAIQQDFKCPKCYPRNNGTSFGENEISDYISSLNFNVVRNTRKIISPFELDIFIPERNIAIEYCGLYHHSEEKLKERNVYHPEFYHLNKLEMCEKIGIQLITIFEDEWIYKKELVKRRLKHILGKFDGIKIFSRNCEIKEIESSEKNNFLDLYHIQGKDNSLVKIGAFYNNELVSVMTFSSGNISKGSIYKEGVWELNRFCSNYNFHIPGIASRMLDFFKKKYNWIEIYSYADRRWSKGNLYEQLGFKVQGKPRLNYWYVKNYERIHRFNLRKKPDEPKNISERILRLSEGYLIVWDCGNLKFVLKNN